MFEDGSVSWEQMKKISGLDDDAMAQLTEEGYIKADVSYFGSNKHYFPTNKARKYLTEHGERIYVGTLQRAPLKNELHDDALRNLRLGLEGMGYGDWQSERCLRQRGMTEFTPDGILEIGRRKIAIELEFSRKTVDQYKAKFEFYERHPAIDAVIYFVATPKLRETILSLSKHYPKIFVILHKNFTEHGQNGYVERSGLPAAVRLWKFLEVIKVRRFVQFLK